MNRYGFTIIEMLVAVAISSMVSLVLFNGFFQINKTVKLADERMTIESRISHMQHYLNRDLSGATTVIQPEEKPAPKQPVQQQPGQKQEQKPEAKEGEQEDKKAKPIEKIFVCTKQGGRLDSLTFISNNPLPAFWGAQDIKLSPNLARITYQIKEDPAVPGSYLLLRQETSNIADTTATEAKTRPYTFVDSIREITVKFLAKIEEEEEAKKEQEPKTTPTGQNARPATGAKKKKITYKEVEEWDTDKLTKEQKAAEKEKKKGAIQKLIPVRVTFQGSFWDNAKKRSFPFYVTIAIPTDTEFVVKPKIMPFMPTPTPQSNGQPVAMAPQRQQIPLSGTINFLNKFLGPLSSPQPQPITAMNRSQPYGQQMPGTYTPLQGRP